MNYIKKEFVFLGSREDLSKRIAQDLFNYRFAWEWCLSKQTSKYNNIILPEPYTVPVGTEQE